MFLVKKILQGNRSTKVSESDLEPFDSPMIKPIGTIRLEPEINHLSIPKNNSNVEGGINFDSNIITLKITPGLSVNSLKKYFLQDIVAQSLKVMGLVIFQIL